MGIHSLGILPHNNIMKVFACLALVPLVACGPAVPFTAFGGHVTHHAAPAAHHAVHHAVHHAAPVYHKPHYGYEQPKHNCSVQDVVETAEVCTPALETVCNPIELAIKVIVDKEQCYPVTRTVCTESIEEIDNEICTYSYQQKTEATTAKTVEVTFEKQCDTQMVTVCQPTPGYGYHSYGHNYCKEVAP